MNVVAGGNTTKVQTETLANSFVVSHKSKHPLIHGTAIAPLDIYPEHLKTKLHTKTWARIL